jgi:uncharacterized metal-binding protein
MAAGLTHDRITKICLPLVAGCGWLLTRKVELTIGLAASFLFSGLMFGPDLDIHSVQTQRWGWFQWLWQPYRKLVPHRSLLSHGPILGTLGRVLYLGLWVALMLSIGHFSRQWWGFSLRQEQQLWLLGKQWAIAHAPLLWTVLLGLELGAMSHYVADFISSACKKGKSKRSGNRQKKLAR